LTFVLSPLFGFTRLRLAQREFLQARQPFAPREFGQHVGRLKAVGIQRHQAVEPQVGHLGHDLRALAVLAGHHQLGGFLADLLQHRIGALAQQPGDVALLGIAPGVGSPRGDDGGQPAQRVRVRGNARRFLLAAHGGESAFGRPDGAHR
jgi:hypothetical protein